MKINFKEKYTFVLPAHWVGYIVNGDASIFDLYGDIVSTILGVIA